MVSFVGKLFLDFVFVYGLATYGNLNMGAQSGVVAALGVNHLLRLRIAASAFERELSRLCVIGEGEESKAEQK
jgi:hypothetical protein